ncbi:hypothetical protein STEG23_037865, partial [Scotinomys teguina]
MSAARPPAAVRAPAVRVPSRAALLECCCPAARQSAPGVRRRRCVLRSVGPATLSGRVPQSAQLSSQTVLMAVQGSRPGQAEVSSGSGCCLDPPFLSPGQGSGSLYVSRERMGDVANTLKGDLQVCFHWDFKPTQVDIEDESSQNLVFAVEVRFGFGKYDLRSFQNSAGGNTEGQNHRYQNQRKSSFIRDPGTGLARKQLQGPGNGKTQLSLELKRNHEIATSRQSCARKPT